MTTPGPLQVAAVRLVIVLSSVREGMKALLRPIRQYGIPKLVQGTQLPGDLEPYRAHFLQLCQEPAK